MIEPLPGVMYWTLGPKDQILEPARRYWTKYAPASSGPPVTGGPQFSVTLVFVTLVATRLTGGPGVLRPGAVTEKTLELVETAVLFASRTETIAELCAAAMGGWVKLNWVGEVDAPPGSGKNPLAIPSSVS